MRGGQDSSRSSSDHALGALCEMAFGKIMNLYWEPQMGKMGYPDFHPNIDVKGTDNINKRMAIRPHENRKFVYVRIVRCNSLFKIVGFIHGHLAMTEKYLDCGKSNNREPAYLIPYTNLQEMRHF